MPEQRGGHTPQVHDQLESRPPADRCPKGAVGRLRRIPGGRERDRIKQASIRKMRDSADAAEFDRGRWPASPKSAVSSRRDTSLPFPTRGLHDSHSSIHSHSAARLEGQGVPQARNCPRSSHRRPRLQRRVSSAAPGIQPVRRSLSARDGPSHGYALHGASGPETRRWQGNFRAILTLDERVASLTGCEMLALLAWRQHAGWEELTEG